jgi:hypothetical protein
LDISALKSIGTHRQAATGARLLQCLHCPAKSKAALKLNPRESTMIIRRNLALTALAAATLAACGGGGDDNTNAQLSTEDAQGYAADAATMPVTAGNTFAAATKTLQSAVGSTAPASQTATTTVNCALGGTVSWVISGAPLDKLLNRQFDAGETYDITYSACATAITGVVLNGTSKIVVNAADASGFDLSSSATALTATTAQGRFVFDGNWRHQLRSTALAGGGTERVERFTTPLMTLASTVGARQARYELRNMDWTVTDTWNPNNQLVTRAHTGSLELFASTPRRPSATLGVATIGTLVIGSDGLATSGGFSVTVGGSGGADKWSMTYGATTVTIALDLGNDGTVDRTWTLARLFFHGEAG